MKKVLLLIFISQFVFAQGSLVWKKEGAQLPGDGYSWSTPLIMDNMLFWVGQDKGIAAMNAQSGEIAWTDTTNFPYGSYDSPAGYNGMIFIGRPDWNNSENSGLLALDANTGNIVWQKLGMLNVERALKPISKNKETIFVAFIDSLFCLKISDGTKIWSRAGHYNNLLLDYKGENIYAVRSDSVKLEALSETTGDLQWQIIFPENKSILESMAYTEYNSKEYLILSPSYSYYDIDYSFYCVDIGAKDTLWSSTEIGYTGNKSAPVIYGDMVVAGTQMNSTDTTQNVVAFGLTNGQIKWDKPARESGATNSPFPIVLNNQVFFESSVNNVFGAVAADLNSGSVLWTSTPQFTNPWPLTWGSPLLYDNKIYIAKDGEGIFCYDAGEVNQQWAMAGGNIHATNSYYEPLTTDVNNDESAIPANFSLEQNYPNPFNPALDNR